MPEGMILRDRYRLEQLLGRGGMADVYLAFDLRRQVYIAIKLLREDLAEDPEFVRRFQREAEALARLDHPYIVRFYSFERQGNTAFIVMDYVPGTTLRGRIMEAAGPLPLPEITKMLRQVGSALQYAHNEGFIHRDIKPGNIMLRDDGAALLSDFGIARATEASTMTLGPLGTPAYMSPEQILGREADPRTDVYCLGVVVYEMATGRRPFVGDTGTGTSTTEKMRYEHLHVPPADPRIYNRALPPEASAVILRALAKEQAQRWPDVMSFVRSWEQALGLEHATVQGAADATVVRTPTSRPPTGRTATPPRQEPVASYPPAGGMPVQPPQQAQQQLWQPEGPPPAVQRKRSRGPLWVILGAGVFLLGAAVVCILLVTREPTPTATATSIAGLLSPTGTTAAATPGATATRSVAEPVATATANTTFTGDRPAEGILRVASDTAWVDDRGNISIVGEVVNDSNETIANMVQIEALLTDVDGNAVSGEFTTFLDRPVMDPGDKSSFWLLAMADDLPIVADNVSEYELRLTITDTASPDIEITVDNAEAIEEGGFLYIRGTTTNSSDQEFVALSIYSTLYDASGSVLNATIDQIELDQTFGPGQSIPFEGYFPDHFAEAESYYVFITGWTAAAYG
ncbi:MAG: protein kinase domain-containing protein [Anaerolineae bacterium]